MGMMLCSSMPAFEKVYCKYNPESLAIMAKHTQMKSQQALKWQQHTAWSAINKHYAWSAGADLEGGAPGARPLYFLQR